MVPIGPSNPLGGVTDGLAAEAWSAAMLGLWNAGLWLLTLVLQLEDRLLTPDLREAGPAAAAYRLTFGLAAGVVVLMLLVQLGTAALRRDGRGLATALWGCGKFVVVWAGWISWGVAVVAVCGGLTRQMLHSLLGVRGWSDWRPSVRLDALQVVDATVATVLGLLGLVLWVAAVGHLLVMITRAASLVLLAAVTPIAAAGLVGDAGRGWFWKSVRWFHAAALTPVLMALMIGVGTQTTAGVAQGLADGPGRAIGTALPGVLLILMSCFAPLALFRLLAFVDPTTPAGMSVRQALGDAAQARILLGGAPLTGGADASSSSPADEGGIRQSAAVSDLTEATADDSARGGSAPTADTTPAPFVSGGPWSGATAPDPTPGPGQAAQSSPAGPGCTTGSGLAPDGPASEVSALGGDSSASRSSTLGEIGEVATTIPVVPV